MLEFIKERIEYYSTIEKWWTTDFIQDLYTIKRYIDEENKKRVNWASKDVEAREQNIKAKQKSTWK